MVAAFCLPFCDNNGYLEFMLSRNSGSGSRLDRIFISEY